jgi:hypothetical protein
MAKSVLRVHGIMTFQGYILSLVNRGLNRVSDIPQHLLGL